MVLFVNRVTAYGDWAEKYDHDLLQEMGYVAPMIATRLLQDHLAHKGARVLDAGCGTGIVGELLYQNGYGNIEELVRITKPGGWLCFTVREQAWEDDDYRTRVEDMEGRGLWKRKQLTTADYIRQEGARCKVCLYKIAA